MKKLLGVLLLLLAFGSRFASATTICPTTSNTNTDCGYILTIGPGSTITGVAVAGANPYDGSDDALIGVVNKSGSVFTGSILLSGSGNGGGLFDFDGDGICTFIGPGRVNASSMGTYCSSAASNGSDPADYQGPDNTFSNISTKSVFDDTGYVNITGLAAGGTTFFSLESAPASITIAPPVISSTPEPSSLVLLSSGLLGAAATLRRRFAV